jgi:hypothetical protein
MGAAYVARTFLLNAGAGISRVVWYAWTSHGLFGIDTVSRLDNRTPTLAGTAYAVTYRWMVGARMMGCSRSTSGATSGMWTCTLRSGNGVSRVVWHPSRSFGLRAPAGTTALAFLNGKNVKARAGARVPVSPTPVLIRGSR